MTEEEYFRYIFVYNARRVDEKNYAALFPYMFTVAIHTGRLGDMHGYEDRWCYHDHDAALKALNEWEARGFKGEPEGWHRHPSTGRIGEGYPT